MERGQVKETKRERNGKKKTGQGKERQERERFLYNGMLSHHSKKNESVIFAAMDEGRRRFFKSNKLYMERRIPSRS